MSRVATSIKLAISGALLLTPLLSVTAVAQTTTPPATPPATSPSPTATPATPPATTTTTTTTTTPSPTPATTETAQDRINRRIAAFKTKLTAVEQRRLTTKCQGAQAVTKVHEARVVTIIENRGKVYTNIDRNLTNLANRLSKQNVDISTLSQQQAELKEKATKLKTDAEAYKQALTDLSAMDCVKDPTGFKASLDEARTLHDALIKEAAELRAYTVETLTGTLQQISTQLKTASGNQ